MSRRAFGLRVVLVGLLVTLGVGGYVHGIYWAGGINQPGNGWTGPGCQANGGCMPWQAFLIDFSPFFALFASGVGLALVVRGRNLWGRYQRLPSARQLRERHREEARWQLERDIARLEVELGIAEHPEVDMWMRDRW